MIKGHIKRHTKDIKATIFMDKRKAQQTGTPLMGICEAHAFI